MECTALQHTIGVTEALVRPTQHSFNSSLDTFFYAQPKYFLVLRQDLCPSALLTPDLADRWAFTPTDDFVLWWF